MTRQRDRGRLDVLLVQALGALAGTTVARLYKVQRCGTDTRIGLAVEMHGKACLIQYGDGLGNSVGNVPLSSAWRLATTLSLQSSYGDREPDGLAHYVIPIGRDHALPSELVELGSVVPLGSDVRAMASALVRIHENCNELLDYCEVDTLTGLLNRKTFDDTLFRIATRHDSAGFRRETVPAGLQRRALPADSDRHWLGVLDIDHFKRINDGFGHAIGDEVLLMLANRMKAHFRSEDRLFRFGGEEFVLLLNPASAANAEAGFERFRVAVESQEFPQVGRVTLSLGFAAVNAGDEINQALENADQALYWAKAHGRNRVASYESLVRAGELPPQPAPKSEFELF